MSDSPCRYGRRQAAALASMNVRAVTTPKGLSYLAPPLKTRSSNTATSHVGPRFQPRNESGQFVSFERLHILVACAYERTVCNDRTVDEEGPTDVEAFPWGEGCPNWY